MIQSFQVNYTFPVLFSENIFLEENIVFRTIIEDAGNIPPKILLVIDRKVLELNVELVKKIEAYFKFHKDVFQSNPALVVLEGGESSKNDFRNVEIVLEAINKYGICRHSYVVAIGGGALLDMAGFAAAIAHRGIRHIRIPTTVLSQNDSGVGVKNGINFFGKKNFIGTFAPPFAVINDFSFLKTLDIRDWRSGFAEAVKVSLIKDKEFFYYLQKNEQGLNERDMKYMKHLVQRCAELHLQHIASGDPFEKGSSRPLDFGHWAAHKLEYLTNYELRHGEAVAIGLALDSTYSYLIGMLADEDWKSIISLLKKMGFSLYTEELLHNDGESLLEGLAEFREHLGGKLTIMLLEEIGKGKEVHYIDEKLMISAAELLKKIEGEHISA